MAVKKRRRAVTSPIERANQKTDEEFITSYLAPGAPGAAPWVTAWRHPVTGAVYDVSLARSGCAGEAALETCFDLIEETSRQDYDKSVQKWRPIDKRREMREPDLRYIFVRSRAEAKPVVAAEAEDEAESKAPVPESSTTDAAAAEATEDADTAAAGAGPSATDPADATGAGIAPELAETAPAQSDNVGAIRGFTSLMPTYEEGQLVVYCYEIHLMPELIGTGLSALLMGFLYTVAYNLPPITKVMLTCFLSNERAMRFYRKQGFDLDSISPEARTLRGKTYMPDYTIMSKVVRR